MNLVTIADHTFDEALLPEKPYVLDVGCRGTVFIEGLAECRPLVRYYGIDPDETISHGHAVALVGSGEVERQYARFSTGEGNHLGSGYGIPDCSPIAVPCVSLQALMKLWRVPIWDLVKLDCEGSEFDILEHWPGPVATQISVEFHDALNPGRWNDEYFAWLFSQLRDYEVVRHERTQQGGAWGHWDSLLVRRRV